MVQPEQPIVGNGILDAKSAELIATDSVLREWLGSRPLKELLPDLDLAAACSAHTRICPFKVEPAFAKVAITPLEGTPVDGNDWKWRLLRIELSPVRADFEQYLDAVTGLPDRRALEPHRLQWTHESPDNQVPHALLFMDLDGFKQINDQFGHAIGDRVLTVVAQRLRNALRSRDLIVRYGGDEFVALIAGVRSRDDAAPILERLQQVIAAPIVVDRRSLDVRATIGVALTNSSSEPLESLIAAADEAMYAAKRMVH